jgi:hypothetical protein
VAWSGAAHVLKDVVLEIDVALRAADGGEYGWKCLLAILQDLHPVAREQWRLGDGLDSRADIAYLKLSDLCTAALAAGRGDCAA